MAVALAQFGLRSLYVSVLPEKNPIADAAIGDLRRFGVDASEIVRGKGRMGIYYIEAGTNQRPSKSSTTASTWRSRSLSVGDINRRQIFD